MKRISDLESSVLYLESKNSALEEELEKNRNQNEKLLERLDLVESRLEDRNKEDETVTSKMNEEMKNLKSMFLEVLSNCESFECRVSLLEIKSKDRNESLRNLKTEQINLEKKIV